MLTTAALEQSLVATWVNSSPIVLGVLSGLHLIGFTLVVGTALVGGLHMVGFAFGDRPAREVTRHARRVIAAGLATSVVTGSLLVSPRAGAALANWIFDLKLILLAAAVLAQIAVGRFAVRADAGVLLPLRVWGLVTAVLWLAVGVAGSAFILLE